MSRLKPRPTKILAVTMIPNAAAILPAEAATIRVSIPGVSMSRLSTSPCRLDNLYNLQQWLGSEENYRRADGSERLRKNTRGWRVREGSAMMAERWRVPLSLKFAQAQAPAIIFINKAAEEKIAWPWPQDNPLQNLH